MCDNIVGDAAGELRMQQTGAQNRQIGRSCKQSRSTDSCAIHGFLRNVWIHRLRNAIHGLRRRSTDCAQHIRIRHPIFAIRIVFVTWCIRSSPTCNWFLRVLIFNGIFRWITIRLNLHSHDLRVPVGSLSWFKLSLPQCNVPDPVYWTACRVV